MRLGVIINPFSASIRRVVVELKPSLQMNSLVVPSRIKLADELSWHPNEVTFVLEPPMLFVGSPPY